MKFAAHRFFSNLTPHVTHYGSCMLTIYAFLNGDHWGGEGQRSGEPNVYIHDITPSFKKCSAAQQSKILLKVRNYQHEFNDPAMQAKYKRSIELLYQLENIHQEQAIKPRPSWR